ncbi:MAG TPA: iron-containing alcohol dehydrogenase [Thermoleophilia bacterium]|nr:iron-containing alcohol dehydrogenase [Thermoleophilia bacterium]
MSRDTFDLAAVKRRLAEADGGRLQPAGLGAVRIGHDALASLPEVVRGLLADRGSVGPVALLSDARPKLSARGELRYAVEELLSRCCSVAGVVVGDEATVVHADERTLDEVSAGCRGAACIVAAGSGTIADIGKAVAARLGAAYVIVQTANSVNGFADDRSVLLVSGVKRTTQTTWADALLIDTDVLVGAPTRMNISGFADLIATFTAPADWYLANVLKMDHFYSPTAVALARDRGAGLLEAAPRVPEADPAALEYVAATLVLSGLSMGVAGTTAPGSGMEHTVGHLIDMAAMSAGRDNDLHGIQVGVASICSAVLWQHVLAALADGGLRRVRVAAADEARARVIDAFTGLDPSGAMARECWSDYERKLARWTTAQGHLDAVADEWADHDRVLRGLLATPRDLVAALGSAGAPLRFSELEPAVDRDTVRWALASCHLMRDRFSVADLAWSLGLWDDRHVDDLIAETEAIVSGAA